MISLESQVYRKVMVVGDSACGKSAMLQRSSKRRWVGEEYCPTVFEDSSTVVDIGTTRVEMALLDTSGADARLRPLVYPGIDVVLICFSILDVDTLAHVEKNWVLEIRHYCPGVHFLLVGLQKDGVSVLRKKGKKVVSRKQAKHVADNIRAQGYVQCSARTGKGVDEVFKLAAEVSLMPR